MASRERVFGFVRAFIEEHGYSPTTREISAGIGLSVSVTHYHLGTLKAEGRLASLPCKGRTLRVLA